MSSGGGTYSIEIQIKGAVQAQQQLKSIGDSMSDMDSTFKSSKSGIDSAGQSLEQFTSGISQAKQPLDQLGSSIDQLGQSSQQLGSSINPLSSEFSALSDSLGRVDSSLKTSNQSLQQAGQGFAQLGQAIQTSSTPLAQFGQGMQVASQSLTSFTGALSPLGSTLSSISGDITSAGTSLASLNRDLESSADALRSFSSSTGTLESDMSSLVGSSSALGHAFSDAAREATNASGGINEYNTLLGQTTQKTEEVQSKTQTLGQAFQGQVGGITAVIGAGTSLFLMYNNLTQAQIRVETASVRLESMQLRSERALIALNKAVAEHGQFSQQAAIAQQAYEVAQGRVAVASERLNQAQIQQNVTFANFAQQIVPTVVTAIGSVVSVFSNLTREGVGGVSILDRLRDAFGGAGQGAAEFGSTTGELSNNLATMTSGAADSANVLGKLGMAIKGTAVSVKELSVAFLTNPITLLGTALAAVIGTITAFTYNLGGARDAINGFGKAIGDAVPFLRPVLDWLKEVGLGFRQMAGTLSQGGTLIRDEFGNIQLAATESMTASSIQVDEFGNTVATTLPANVNSGVNEVIAAFDRMTMRLTSSFRPAVQDTLTFFQQTFGQTIQVVKESSDTIGELGIMTGQSLEYMNAAVQGAAVNFGELGNVFQVVKRDADTFEITTGTLRAVMQATGMTAQEVIGVFNSMGLELVEITEIQKGVIAGNKIIEVSFATISNVAAKVEERIAAMTEKYGQLSPEVENAARALLTQQLTMEATGQATETFTAAQQKAYDTMRTGIDTTADLATRYEQFKASMDSTIPSMDQLTAGFNRETGAILQMTNALAPAIKQIQASTQGMTDQKSVLDGLAPSFKANADSVILMSNGMAEIITPAQIVNSILSGQANELNNVNGLMDMYTQHVKSAGISLVEYIALLEQAGIIDSQTAQALEDRGKALGLITEEEIKAAEATAEHVTVTQELINSNKELATSLAETAAGIQEGTLLQEAFNKGWMDTDKAFQDSIVSLAETQASLTRYNQLLAEGKIQSVAFAEGQHEMISTFQQMDEAMANIEGQMLAFDNLLKSGDVSLKAFNLGLREGQLEARNWFTELQNASGSTLGMERGLITLANNLNTTIPEAFRGSTESMQQWIAVTTGSIDAIRELNGWLDQTAAGLSGMMEIDLDDWADDLDEGIEEANEKIEEFLDEIGGDEDGPGAIQLRVRMQTDVLQTELDKVQPLIAGVIDTGDKTLAANLKQWFSENVTEGLEDAEPQVVAKAEQISSAINAVINAKTPEETNAAVLRLQQSLADVASDVGGLDLAAPFETGKEAVVKYSDEIDTLVSKIVSMQPQLAGFEADLAGLALNAPGTIAPLTEEQPTTPTTPTTPTIDTAPAKAAMDELLTYATNIMNQIAQTGQHVSTIWAGHFNTAVTNASNQMNTLLANAVNVMNQIAITPQHVATSWLGHFTTASTNATTAMNTILSEAVNIMNQVAQTAQHVESMWLGHFTNAANNANSAMTTILSTAVDTMNQVAQTATHVETIWSSTFGRIVTMVTSSMSQINTALDTTVSHAESVATAIDGIGTAASNATSEVEALTDAINAVPTDITVTFNIVVTGDSIPSGGTLSAAGGLGYHDGTLYMAGGSTGGISGQGFAPVLIDHPTKLTVGESGPELVSVTPINRNRNSKTGEISPFANFANLSLAKGSSDKMISGQGFGGTINTQSVVFDQNQGPITINGGGNLSNAGLPTTSGGFTNNNVGLGVGQGGTFNVPGGQVSTIGNAVACVNGQCFGNMQGFGPALNTGDGTLGGQQQQGFQPIFDDKGMIKAIETLVEWFKFLGLPTGASVPGTGNFTNPGTGTITTGRGAFAQAGQGAFAGQISMQGGQIVFDSNQGKMQVETTTGAISIAGQGGAFASAGNARAGVGLFGTQDQTNEQLTQLNRTMQDVSGSLQAVGNSMASLGNEVVFGNEQIQQTFQGINTGLQGLNTTTQQGFQGFANQVINGVNLMGSGSQVGFQGFTLPNGQQGGAVGAGGAANNPLGFLGSMLGGFGINNPFQGAVPSGGTGTPTTGGGGLPTTGGTGNCSVCGAANGLQGAATDLSGAAGQLGNAVGQLPTGSTGGYGTPTTGGGMPTGGNLGGGGGIPTGGSTGGPDCSCSCMPMDSDPNRFKIETPEGRDCVNHQYFATMAECESRLNEVKANCGGTAPTPTPTPTPTQPSGPQLGGNVSAMANGGMAMASAGGVTAIAGGGLMSGGIGQPVLGGIGMPIGNPPIPPRIAQTVGLPSQHIKVNQDPDSWRIIESPGTVGTFDIIDDSGDVVQLGFRTVTAAQEYLNYFISYYKWVKSGSSGILGGGVQTRNIAFASASVGGGGGQLGGMPTGGNLGGTPAGGLPTGGTPTTQQPTPPQVRILEPEMTTPESRGADQIQPSNTDPNTWKIAEQTRTDGQMVFFVVETTPTLRYVTTIPFATRQDAQSYIDYYKILKQPPQQFPSPGQQIPQVPTTPGIGTGVGGGIPGINIGGGGGGVQAIAGMGGAFAQAGNAIAQAGSFLGSGLGFGSGKKLGPTPVPSMPFEEIPRPSGPFRSGQDNQEPIYDNSRVKIGADVGDPGTVSMQDIEEGGGGGKKKPRLQSRLQRHLDTALAIAGGTGELYTAIVSAITKAFGDIMLNFNLNTNLDGNSIYKSQKKYMLKQVSVFT
jgi:uncharacterized phage infection (PIP) family protein YhgE